MIRAYWSKEILGNDKYHSIAGLEVLLVADSASPGHERFDPWYPYKVQDPPVLTLEIWSDLSTSGPCAVDICGVSIQAVVVRRR